MYLLLSRMTAPRPHTTPPPHSHQSTSNPPVTNRQHAHDPPPKLAPAQTLRTPAPSPLLDAEWLAGETRSKPPSPAWGRGEREGGRPTHTQRPLPLSGRPAPISARVAPALDYAAPLAGVVAMPSRGLAKPALVVRGLFRAESTRAGPDSARDARPRGDKNHDKNHNKNWGKRSLIQRREGGQLVAVKTTVDTYHFRIGTGRSFVLERI